MKRIRHLIFLPFLFAGFDAASAPLYPNSVVSNDLEFIKTSDQSVFTCLSYDGTRRAEMPDKRSDTLFANGTFIYTARYKDGTSIELWAHPDFGSQSAAMASVEPVAQAVGKLPTLMRSKLDHVVVHEGDETAFAEDKGHFFVLYSDNILMRIRNHDLEETIFHESVHATLDNKYVRSRNWRRAQEADGDHIRIMLPASLIRRTWRNPRCSLGPCSYIPAVCQLMWKRRRLKSCRTVWLSLKTCFFQNRYSTGQEKNEGAKEIVRAF